jgi:acyl-coenzyme A thioesterase PaaI-like protein
MKSPPFDPAVHGWQPPSDHGFVEHVGPIWTKPHEGALAHGFVAEQKHANLLNVVQGGMLMTFADRAMGLAAWRAAGEAPCVTIQFDMGFIRPAHLGSFVELLPHVVRKTKTLVFVRGELTVAHQVIATAHGVWKILDAREISEIDAGKRV